MYYIIYLFYFDESGFIVKCLEISITLSDRIEA